MRKNPQSEARESSLSSGWTVEATPAPAAPAAPIAPEPGAAPAGEEPAISNVAVMLLGVFGGVFLLYSWAWFTIAQYYSAVNAATAATSGSLGGVLQQIIFWVAPLAPAAWFVTSLVLCRTRGTLALALALVLGMLVLLPLPLLITPGGAQ